MPIAKLVTLTMMVSHLHCSEWERMDNGTWRAEGSATIYFEDSPPLTLSRVDVAKDSDLYDTLEALCRTDLDGGVEDN